MRGMLRCAALAVPLLLAAACTDAPTSPARQPARGGPSLTTLSPYPTPQLRRYPTFGSQSGPGWWLDAIDQAGGALDGRYSYWGTGEGVNIYVVDSGILTTHTEFGGRASLAVNTSGGYDGDCSGHGTAMASAAAGTTYGVAKRATIWSVHVLDCGSNPAASIVTGLRWVRDHHLSPAVVNLSLGRCADGAVSRGSNGGVVSLTTSCGTAGPGADTALDNAVKDVIAHGVTVVVSAGNDKTDACKGSPGRVPEAITVAAADSTRQQSYYSNYGTCVDLYAPANPVTLAWYTGDSDVNAHIDGGTSSAAAFTTGVAALYLENNPTATPAQVQQEIVNRSNRGLLTGLGAGSPNRFLYGYPTAPIDMSGPTYAYNQTVRVVAAPEVGNDFSTLNFVWDYQFCYNGALASDCNGVWRSAGSGLGMNSAQQYVRSGDYWVTLRARVYSGSVLVGEGSWRIEGAGEGSGGGGGGAV